MNDDAQQTRTWVTHLSIAVLIGAMALLLVWLQWGRCLAWDELEFNRATQWVSHGRVPFRDFWEHHGPLQWCLMAPAKRLVQGPGASTILWMRWMQVPFWGLAGWCVYLLALRSKAAVWLRLSVCALPLLSPLFTLWAVEYRPDTLSTSLLLVGLMVWRVSRRRLTTLVAGSVLSLCAMSNLRMAGLSAFVFLLCLMVRPASRRWGVHRRWLWLVLGGGLPFLVWGIYLAATSSATVAFRYLVADNTWFNGLPVPPWRGTPWSMPFQQGDITAMLLLIASILVTLKGLFNLRRPGLLGILAMIQAVQVASISRLSIHYPYHLQSVLVVAALQAGVWLAQHHPVPGTKEHEFFTCWLPLIPAGLLLFAWVHLGVANSRSTLAFQNRLMVRLDGELEPADRVLDGVGFILRHEPAYAACWFLPTLARALSLQGRLPSYPPETLLSDPPGAILFSSRVYWWIGEWPALQLPMASHFLPETPFIWKPGLSARVTPQAPSATWSVPRSGRYRLYAEEALAAHPWFKSPFQFFLLRGPASPKIQLNATMARRGDSGSLEWQVNGARLEPDDGWMRLTQGDRLQMNSKGRQPIGVFLVPENMPRVFQGCGPEESLDSDLMNIWPTP